MSGYYYDNGRIEVTAIRTSRHNYINYVYLCNDKNTKEALLVDPAWDAKKIEECISKKGVHLKMILLTHTHEDHTNLAEYFAEKYDVAVHISNEEIEYYNFNCKNIKGFVNEDIFFLNDINIKCMLTPGHTVGSTCFFVDDVLFSGDTLFIEGCGSCEFAGGSKEQMYDSLLFLKERVFGETKVFPGHKFKSDLGVSFDYVKENNIYFYSTTKNQFIKMKERYSKGKIINGC
ncbi:MAG: MBL fold metallo-hydrolase [Lachnospiraceae bacterium]|nr:MBL fold metallo-hydrolase [Lachnospiraceae bacterium]